MTTDAEDFPFLGPARYNHCLFLVACRPRCPLLPRLFKVEPKGFAVAHFAYLRRSFSLSLPTTTMATPVVAAAIPSVSTIQKAASSSSAGFNHANLVFNVDIFLLAFLAFFVLLSLPRAVIRFSHKSEWFAGLYLRWVEPRPWRPPTFYQLADELDIPTTAYVSPSKSTPWPSNHNEDGSEDGHKAALSRNASSSSRAHLLRNNTKSSTQTTRAQLVRAQSRRNRKLDLPVHMPSWTTMLPSLSWITRIPIRPGLTVGGASIMVAYFATLCFAGFFDSNIFSDPIRMGWVAISQIPVVVVLSAKNNIVGMLIGACYTRVRSLLQFYYYTSVLTWRS